MKKKKEVFNPIKEDESGKIAKRMIWSTESLNLAIKGLEEGKKLISQYEETDKADGTYTENFYAIVDEEHCSVL